MQIMQSGMPRYCRGLKVVQRNGTSGYSVKQANGVASVDYLDAIAGTSNHLSYLQPGSRAWNGILCLCAAMAPERL